MYSPENNSSGLPRCDALQTQHERPPSEALSSKVISKAVFIIRGLCAHIRPPVYRYIIQVHYNRWQSILKGTLIFKRDSSRIRMILVCWGRLTGQEDGYSDDEFEDSYERGSSPRLMMTSPNDSDIYTTRKLRRKTNKWRCVPWCYGPSDDSGALPPPRLTMSSSKPFTLFHGEKLSCLRYL